MAEATDILTLAEARAALNQGSTYTGDDTKIAAIVTALSQRLDDPEAGVGPVVTRAGITETHDGGVVFVKLRQFPVQAVTAVTEDGTAITSDGWHIDTETGHLFRQSGDYDDVWECGRDNVEVTYTAGRYASTALVDEYYKEGARLFLKHLWRAEQWSSENIGGSDFDVPQVAFPSFAMPMAVKDWFKKTYRGDWGGFA